MKPRILLLSGFEPFGGDGFNPSGGIAWSLDREGLSGGVQIHGITLPVNGPAAWEKLARNIRQLEPHWIIATGVSGRAELSIETTAWNEADYRLPDNLGEQPQGVKIMERGPASLVSPAALDLLAGTTRLEPPPGVPALAVRGSHDPGRFVCNFLYYRLLHLTRRANHPAHQRAAFWHLPATPEMRRSNQDLRFFYPLDGLGATVRHLLEAVVHLPEKKPQVPGGTCGPGPALD